MFHSTDFLFLSGMDTDGEALQVKHDLFTLAPISVQDGRIAYRISKDNEDTQSNQTEAFFVIEDTDESVSQELLVENVSEGTNCSENQDVKHDNNLVQQNRTPSKIIRNLKPQNRKSKEEYKNDPEAIKARRQKFIEKINNMRKFQKDAKIIAPDYVNSSILVAERPSESGYSNSFVAQRSGEFPKNVVVLPPNIKHEDIKQVQAEEMEKDEQKVNGRKTAKPKATIPAQKAKLNERLVSIYGRLSKTALGAQTGLVLAISVNEASGPTVRYLEFGDAFKNMRITLSSDMDRFSIQPILLPKILKAQAEQKSFLKSPKDKKKATKKGGGVTGTTKKDLFVTISNPIETISAENPGFKKLVENKIPLDKVSSPNPQNRILPFGSFVLSPPSQPHHSGSQSENNVILVTDPLAFTANQSRAPWSELSVTNQSTPTTSRPSETNQSAVTAFTPESAAHISTTKSRAHEFTTTEPGANVLTSEPGVNMFTTEPGVNLFTTEPGENVFTTEPGANVFTTDAGANVLTTEPGVNVFTNQAAPCWFNNQSTANDNITQSTVATSSLLTQSPVSTSSELNQSTDATSSELTQSTVTSSNQITQSKVNASNVVTQSTASTSCKITQPTVQASIEINQAKPATASDITQSIEATPSDYVQSKVTLINQSKSAATCNNVQSPSTLAIAIYQSITTTTPSDKTKTNVSGKSRASVTSDTNNSAVTDGNEQVTPAATRQTENNVKTYYKKILMSDTDSEQDLETPVKNKEVKAVVNAKCVSKKLFGSNKKQAGGKPKKPTNKPGKQRKILGTVGHGIKRPQRVCKNKIAANAFEDSENDTESEGEEKALDTKYSKGQKLMKVKNNFLCETDIENLL